MAEFYLDPGPLPVSGFEDQVNFETCLISVIECFRISHLGVCQQATNAQAFEEEAERLEVIEKS